LKNPWHFDITNGVSLGGISDERNGEKTIKIRAVKPWKIHRALNIEFLWPFWGGG
jgi:hypothetical protein